MTAGADCAYAATDQPRTAASEAMRVKKLGGITVRYSNVIQAGTPRLDLTDDAAFRIVAYD